MPNFTSLEKSPTRLAGVDKRLINGKGLENRGRYFIRSPGCFKFDDVQTRGNLYRKRTGTPRVRTPVRKDQTFGRTESSFRWMADRILRVKLYVDRKNSQTTKERNLEEIYDTRGDAGAGSGRGRSPRPGGPQQQRLRGPFRRRALRG